MNIGLLFAILSPLCYAIMAVLDKYIISKKVKNIYTYLSIVGIVNIFYAIIISLFLDWSSINISYFLFSVLTGILYLGQSYFYTRLLEKEDVSHTVGLLYLYPIFVAILSFIVLKETLSIWGYVGISLVVVGSILLSTRFSKKNFKKSMLWICCLTILIAFYEFSIKLTTNNVPPMNAMILNTFVFGLLTCLFLFNKKNRVCFAKECKNINWILLSEVFTILSVITIFIAMANLQATIVAAISAIEPLMILVLEFFLNIFTGITRDTKIVQKLIPICLIVIGVILIYGTQI